MKRSVLYQRGFTLIELLIALALVLVVLVSVQRYIVGVTIDQQGVSERRSQATQTRIVLSNMQRDVAQAGYVPYASGLELKTPFDGVSITAKQLTVMSYQPASTARDCNNASKQFTQDDKHNQDLLSNGWIRVQNIYSINKSGSVSCKGNGARNSAAVLDDVIEMVVTDETVDSATIQLIRVCLVTSEEWTSIGDVPATTMCDGTTHTPEITRPNGIKQIYFKTIADMPVLTSSFKAGQ